jgi:hypothetical protein
MKHRWKLDEYGKPDEWAWESGFHNGVYCEDCGETVCVHCDQDWFEWDDCSGPPERKKKTNGDKIRSMNDDELAKWMSGGAIMSSAACSYCKHNKKNTCADASCGDKTDVEIIMEWLKQPVEE